MRVGWAKQFLSRGRTLKTAIPIMMALVCSACGTQRIAEYRRAQSPYVPGYDYVIPLPAEFKQDKSAHGIDSRVDVWNSKRATVSTDFGIYGAIPCWSPREHRCELREVTAAGIQSTLGYYPETGSIHLSIPVEPGTDLRLVIFADCDTVEYCEELLPVLLQTEIIRR